MSDPFEHYAYWRSMERFHPLSEGYARTREHFDRVCELRAKHLFGVLGAIGQLEARIKGIADCEPWCRSLTPRAGTPCDAGRPCGIKLLEVKS